MPSDTSSDCNDKPLWLALDQGGHASRALVFNQRGQQVAHAYAAISTERIGSDRVEHNADEIVASLRKVIDDVAKSLGVDVRRVRAAGLATQRSSVVCWDQQNGNPLSPVLSWQDRRNADLVTALRPYKNEIQEQTGLVLSPHYGASKLRWCLDHLAAVQTAQQMGCLHCGPLASYLLFTLLKERPYVVDPANASRTQLWSPASGAWCESLLQKFGIPNDLLPKPVPTQFNYGSLNFGHQTIPLRICTGDQAAMPFANGPLHLDTLYVNLGTGAFIMAPTHRSILHAAPLLRSVLCSEGDTVMYALEGTVNGAGAALSWWANQSGIDPWPNLNSLSRTQITGKQVPFFINAVGGIASPYWSAESEPRFIENSNHDDQDYLIAIIESIAFLINANIQIMRKHLPSLNKILVGGGLSACIYLNECLADLSGLPVMRLSERELTGRGLAYLTAARPHDWQHISYNLSIKPTSNAALHDREQRWRTLIED